MKNTKKYFNNRLKAVFILVTAAVMLFFTSSTATARTMVIPFKVTPADDAAHQWLGRAVSYYLTYGLELNGVDAIPDRMTEAVLETNHIRFPYNVTKASILRLARRYNAGRVIWGEVSANGGNETELQVKAFVIDLDGFSQKYLPLLKGKPGELYGIQEELLKHVSKTIAPGKIIQLPAFDFNHRTFELLVKSLLLTDKTKRIELIEKAIRSDGEKRSAHLELELAKVHSINDNMKETAAIIEKLENKRLPGLLDAQRNFLKARLFYHKGEPDKAVQLFKELARAHGFAFEANHNLGVIYTEKEEWDTAAGYFRGALEHRSDPETWLNLIQALVSGEEWQKAATHVVEALKRFPAREDLRQWFSLVLSQSGESELLASVFELYIQDFYVSEETPEAKPKLKSPFNVHLVLPVPPPDENNETTQSTKNNDIAASIEQLQDLLAINPFISDYYRNLSILYLENKEFYRAERHAMAALFLEKTKPNLDQLIKVYRLLGKNKKANALTTK